MVKITKKLISRFLELSLNPVPVEKNSKVPLRKKHTDAFDKDEINNYEWGELDVGVSTGFASLNLEALDFDLKNADDPEEFMREFNKLIPEELFSKLLIQKTPSGGFHYIYRADDIESNQKLARNNRGEAIIETRGIGGYIKCYPSKGYEIVKNNFDSIPYLTKEERNFLIIISKQKDLLNKQDIKKKYSREDLSSFKKFPEYNDSEQIGIDLLEAAGWTYHSRNGDWYNMTRPDSDSKELHGGYNEEGKFFQTFSTAQDMFQERRGYNNHALFAELECDGNYKKAYSILYDQGWGVKEDGDDDDDDELDFVSSFTEENDYLEQARRGDIPLGVSIGWETLDKNIKLKKNSFVFLLGLDNVGKSTLLSSIMVSTNVLHGYKWGVSSPEANVATTRRNLIEAKAGRVISDLDKSEYDELLEQSRAHFPIITTKKHYSIEEILEKGKILYQKFGIDFLIIDPFSFYSGSGSFLDDSEILSKIRVFSQNYCSVIVVDHPYTGFTRTAVDPKSGFIRMPTKYDASGGSIKANKADDFICFHRLIHHPDSDMRRTMQISVQKVKDKYTGGEPHVEGEWGELIYKTFDGFTGYWDSEGNNPIYKARQAKLGMKAKINPSLSPRINPEDAF